LTFLETKDGIIRYGRLSNPFGGAGEFTGSNPNRSARVAYYMKKRHTFGKMSASLHDSEGNFIKDLPAGKSAGVNIIDVPIFLPLPKSAPTMNRTALGGSLTPPTLPEGTYTVKIKKGKEEYSTEVTIKAADDTPYPAADRQLAHKTQMQLYNMTEQLAYMYDALGEMHEQATAHSEVAKKKKVAEQLDTFAKATKELRSSLVALEGDFYVDSSSSLREDISTLALGVGSFPGKPTTGQLNKATELQERLDEVTKQFEAFQTQLQTINTQLEKQEAKPIEVKTFEAFKAA
jgi:cell fate (sporulation/competence/biofilm development) regulator YlbF (YheA/YmcA/DUF963 family)